MNDGHGDCGGAHIGSGEGGDDVSGLPIKPHEVQPLDNPLKVNGAPVTERSHEYLIKKNDAQN